MGLEWLWLLGSLFLCYFSICVDIYRVESLSRTSTITETRSMERTTSSETSISAITGTRIQLQHISITGWKEMYKNDHQQNHKSEGPRDLARIYQQAFI